LYLALWMVDEGTPTGRHQAASVGKRPGATGRLPGMSLCLADLIAMRAVSDEKNKLGFVFTAWSREGRGKERAISRHRQKQSMGSV
jgi:hypothetical protein